MNENTNTFSFPVYASGVRVYFSLEFTSFEDALSAVNGALAAGFTAREMGVEEGEQTYDVMYIVRREKANSDGTYTPIIDMYSEQDKFRFVSVYLNTQEDIAAFESACGVRLDRLPLYEASAPIKRGENAKIDGKNVVTLPARARLIWITNPNFNPNDEEQKVPKRKFVRWMQHGTQQPTVTQSVTGAGGKSRKQAPQPVQNAPATDRPWTAEQAKRFYAAVMGDGNPYKISKQTLFQALGIKEKLGEFQGSEQDAFDRVARFLEDYNDIPVN